jgi:AcrR family transcriptional regulator
MAPLSRRPPPKRQRPLREETRERILDAAVALFFEVGPTAASVEAVAARAGLTKGAVYSSFGSKDELFAAVVERLPTLLLTDVLAGATSRDDVQHALRKLGEMVATLPPPEAATAGIHELYAIALRNSTARETIASWVGRMIQDAADAQPADMTVPLRVSYRDLWIVGQALIEGLVIRRALNPDLVSDELIAAAIELLAGFVDDDR